MTVTRTPEPATGRGLGWQRWVLIVLAVSAGFVGCWALAAPAGFYRSFPGFGWDWVAAAGPYDEHLVRDVGELNLALLVVSVAAAVRPTRWSVRVAGLAWLVYGVPHLAFHAAHAAQEGRLQLVPLAAVVLLAALLLLPARRVHPPEQAAYISRGM